MTTDTVRVWLVERTYSDDEQNLIILVYATPDGEHYHRKERALTSYSDTRETPISIEIARDRLGTVGDPETRDRYATEVDRVSAEHAPTDTL